jgi:hypothetical protein
MVLMMSRRSARRLPLLSTRKPMGICMIVAVHARVSIVSSDYLIQMGNDSSPASIDNEDSVASTIES